MSDLMLCAVLRMPLDRQIGDPIAEYQLQSRMVNAADELEARATRIAGLSQQLEDAKKDVERYRAHIQESADRADRAIASLNLPEGSHKKELLQVLRDWHLSAIAASKPAKEECDG